MDISGFKIGDELYRYVEVGGIFKHVVYGIRNYDGAVQLEVESQSCSHGWKCKILVAQNDYGKLISVHMLNNDDEDDQKHWNCQDAFHFWPTSNEAKIEALKWRMQKQAEAVSEAEKSLEYKRKVQKEFKEAFDLLTTKEPA